MNKLSAITTFRRVVELSSFVATAKVMDISPAMVTKHIAQLEKQLGTRLLIRSTRSVRVTEQGEAYYRSVCEILDELESADLRAQVGSQSPTGLLKLTAPIELGEKLLPAMIDRFQRQHPSVKVSLDLTDRQVDLFGENYDLAIRAGSLNQPDLIAKKIASLSLVVCAAPAYLTRSAKLKHPSDLYAHNCLLNPNIDKSTEWQFIVRGKPFLQKVNSNLLANSLKVLTQACIQGAGIVYAPRFIFEDLISKGQLTEVLKQFLVPDMDVHLVYPEKSYLPAKVRCFIDSIVDM